VSDIKFECPQCQQHIQCDAGFAGTQIGCPQCAAQMIVPGQVASPAVPSAHKGLGCPSCEAALAPGAVLCTTCGYNLHTGQRLQISDSAASQQITSHDYNLAKWSAILSIWTSFAAIVFVFITGLQVLSQEVDVHGRVIPLGPAWIATCGGGFIALAGVVLAIFALIRIRKVGRRGVLGRALFGLGLSGIELCGALVALIMLLVIEHRMAQFRRENPGLFEPFEGSKGVVERTTQQLDEMAGGQTGDAALVAKGSSEFLKRLRKVGDNFIVRMNALNGSVTNPATLSTRKALRKAEDEARMCIDAIESFSTMSLNLPQIYRDELTKVGASDAAIQQAMHDFKMTPVPQDYWDGSRRWAQAQLSFLGFLDKNWGAWSIHSDIGLVFSNDDLHMEFQTLEAEATKSNEDLQRIQARRAASAKESPQ
jgi:hypothetical protein